jgi:predicted lipoprotein
MSALQEEINIKDEELADVQSLVTTLRDQIELLQAETVSIGVAGTFELLLLKLYVHDRQQPSKLAKRLKQERQRSNVSVLLWTNRWYSQPNISLCTNLL